MREILFRGKRIDNGEWVDGNLFVPDEVTYRKAPTEILVGTNVVRISYEVDPATVGQYTGLTDKNGKRIFEGDIVALERGWGEKVMYTIEYDSKICSFIGDSVNYIGFTTFEDDGDRFEVIGNIHDNPELMKEEST